MLQAGVVVGIGHTEAGRPRDRGRARLGLAERGLQVRHAMANLPPCTVGTSSRPCEPPWPTLEVKAAAALDASDFVGLQALAEVAGKKFVRGVVLYLGEHVAPRGDNLWALPIDELWRPAAG